jgi:hypothetical protein
MDNSFLFIIFAEFPHYTETNHTKLELSFNADDFFLVVRATSLAYSVRHHKLIALTALH